MFFVNQSIMLSRHCRYIRKLNAPRISDLRVLPAVNLLVKPKTIVSKEFSTTVDFLSYDEDTKKYLDYITKAYKDGSLRKDENLGMLIKSKKVENMMNRRIDIMDNISSLEDLAAGDKEMEALSKQETSVYKRELEDTDRLLLEKIVESLDTESFDRIMVQVLAGVGGSEAMIFACDLMAMYINYLDHLGFAYEIMECDKPQPNALRLGNILVIDKQSYHKLRYESGVHRVQRVPLTESHGRIHTSTASVVIYPEPSEVQVKILEKDLKIETKRAGGAGGQHVNTTDSAVRLVHIPTGIVVSSQNQRSQHKNREYAMVKLRTLLYERQMNEQVTALSVLRKQQIGNRTRNEKIRTYNYPQDRVTDHRMTNWKAGSLKNFMEEPAPLEELQDLLHKSTLKSTLSEIMRKYESRLK